MALYPHNLFTLIENDDYDIIKTDYSKLNSLTEKIHFISSSTYTLDNQYDDEQFYKYKKYYKIIDILTNFAIEDKIISDDLLILVSKTFNGHVFLEKFKSEFNNHFIFSKNDFSLGNILLFAKYSPLKCFIFWYKLCFHQIDEEIKKLFLESLINSDDRITKYLLNKYGENYITKNKLEENICKKILGGEKEFKVSKYILKKFKYLSGFCEFKIQNFLKYNLFINNNCNFLKAIFKFYYNKEKLGNYLHFIIDTLFNYENDKKIEIAKYIYDKLYWKNEKAIFYFTFFNFYKLFIPNVNYDFKNLFIQDNEFTNLFRIFYEGPDIFLPNVYNKLITYNKDIMSFYYDVLTFNCSSKDFIYWCPFYKFNQVNHPTFINMNKVNYYLSIWIKKYLINKKLKVKTNNLNLINEIKDLQPIKKIFEDGSVNYQIKKQAFTYQPPYHIYPNQINILNNVLLREKADGVMKKRLPVSILKYFMHLNIIDFKAEYIEELNLYLLFDIKIDQTIEDRYKLLRSLHPYTFKNKNLIEINSFEQLLDEIDNEHKIFENYMENSNDKIKWYPKVAFKVKKFDLNFEKKINDIINKKLEIKFNSYYDNDGLILTPTNGFREIKVKPKNLMTIDLKYDGKNWLDLENNSYNEIIKEEGEYENAIYRCYPEKNYYIPKDIRTDKNKANPCNIVNTIIKLYNSKYKHFDFKRLYYHDKEFKSDTYIKKLLSSQRNFKRYVNKI